MAQPITWQNVGITPAYGATELMGMAQEQYSNAFKGLGDIAQGFRKDNLAKDAANSEAQLNWFTEQTRNLKPEQFTPETMNALLATITDPAARQAAVENFGKLGDEITGRVFNQEKRQAFTADEAQKALLRPYEVDKAKLDLDLGEAQIASQKASAASSYASANASNANAAVNNLHAQELRMQLADAKTAQQEAKALEGLGNKYTAAVMGGTPPADVYDGIAHDNSLTPAQREALYKQLDASINTLNTQDPISRAKTQGEIASLNSRYDTADKLIGTELKAKQAKLQVDPQFSPMVGQEDLYKKINGMTSEAGDAIGSVFGIDVSGYTDARDLGEKIKEGLDTTSSTFVDRLDTKLKAFIPDPAQRNAVISEAQRSGGLYKVQSRALDLIPFDLRDGKKVYALADDGTEFITEFDRTLGAYATSLANELELRKHEASANAARLAIAGERDKQLNQLANSSKRIGAKAAPDLTKSITDNLRKLFSGSSTKHAK